MRILVQVAKDMAKVMNSVSVPDQRSGHDVSVQLEYAGVVVKKNRPRRVLWLLVGEDKTGLLYRVTQHANVLRSEVADGA